MGYSPLSGGAEYFIGVNDIILGAFETTPAESNALVAQALSTVPNQTSPNVLLSYFLNSLVNTSANLSSAWVPNNPTALTIQYYVTNTNTSSGGTLVGTDTVTAGILTDTLSLYSPVSGKYYYIILTLANGTAYTSTPVLMPYAPATGVVINSLSASSTALSSTWIQYPSADVTIQYYVTTNQTPSGGTQVGTTDSQLSGTTADTLSGYTPVAGSYYYVGVTTTGTGVTVYSPLAIIMPYPSPSGATLGLLDPTSNRLSASWNIDAAYTVTVVFYSNTTNSNTGGTAVYTTTVSSSPSGTTSLTTPVLTLTFGSYYYCTVSNGAPSPLTVTSSSSSTQFPYPTPTVYNLALTNATTALNASWTLGTTNPTSATVTYYSNTSGYPTGGGLISTATAAYSPDPNSLSILYTPTPGVYYYTGVSVSGSGSTTYSPSSIIMPPAVASIGTLGALGNPQTYLYTSWTSLPTSPATVQFYSNASTFTTGGTPIGTPISTASGTSNASQTLTLVPTAYYAASVTPTGGASTVYTSTATQMPASAASAVVLGSLAEGATSLSATWSLGATAASAVTVNYYSTNTARTSGGILVASDSVAAGTYSDTTTSYIPTSGSYYYVGVTPTGGQQISSISSIMEPYATVSGVSMTPLTAGTVSLASSWSITSASAVQVAYYSTATATTVGGTLVGAAHYVSSGTTLDNYSTNLVVGSYYHATVTPVGGTLVSSLTSVLMPYPAATSVTIGGLTNTSLALQSAWNVTPSSIVGVRYYSTNTAYTSNGALVGSVQYVSSGTTVNNFSTNLIAGAYYFVSVQPLGGTAVSSLSSVQMSYGVASNAAMVPFSPIVSTLKSSWTVVPPSVVGVTYYSTTTTAPTGGGQVGTTQYVSSGVSTNTYVYPLVQGNYYYVSVLPTSGTSSISGIAVQYPYATVGGLSLSTMTAFTTNLNASLSVSQSSIVQVGWYSNTSNLFTTSAQIQAQYTSTIAGSQTTIAAPVIQPAFGNYYFATANVQGTSTLFSSIGAYMPYPAISTISLSTLTAYTTNLVASWTVNPAYPITLTWYSNTISSVVGATAIQSQSLTSTTLSTIATPTIAPAVNAYYFAGAVSGTNAIVSTAIQLMPNGVTLAQMTSVTNNSSNLEVNWTLASTTLVSTIFYSNNTSAYTGTLLSTFTRLSTPTTIIYPSGPLTANAYYYAIVGQPTKSIPFLSTNIVQAVAVFQTTFNTATISGATFANSFGGTVAWNSAYGTSDTTPADLVGLPTITVGAGYTGVTTGYAQGTVITPTACLLCVGTNIAVTYNYYQTQTMSYTFWAKAPGTPASGRLNLTTLNAPPTQRIEFWNGTFAFGMNAGAIGPDATTAFNPSGPGGTGYTYPPNTWVHYGIVWNGNTWALYINGSLLNTKTETGSGSYANGNASITLNATGYGAAGIYVYDWRVLQTSLTSAQVNAIYSGTA